MFRADVYGFRSPPPPEDGAAAQAALLALWRRIHATLTQRLAQENFSHAAQYHDARWWQQGASDEAWARWYLQTHSLWLLWRELCAGGRRTPRWPEAPFTPLPELACEAEELWYLWTSRHAGTPVYPHPEQVVQALQQWLRRFELLRDLELDVSLQPSLADGNAIGRAAMWRHWPVLQRAASRQQWLPLRVIPGRAQAAHPCRSLALLLTGQDGERLCCYEPLAQRTLMLWQDAQQFMLDDAGSVLALHSFYPLASPIAALRPSFWRRSLRYFWRR